MGEVLFDLAAGFPAFYGLQGWDTGPCNLKFIFFFFLRNDVNTCDSTYRCACKYVQPLGVHTSKIMCPQNILHNVIFY